jgi:uncharacterized protein (DUF488 family)
MSTIFTIGHSNHPIERLLELLEQHAIEELVDVRRFPGSRAHPQFNREQMQATLEERGIAYRWMETLGGRRKAAASGLSPNLGLRNASFRNFADYMATSDFRDAADSLIETAAKRRMALMCAEGLWWQCHRRLISDDLTARGAAIEHILPNGHLKPHIVTPGAVAVAGGGPIVYPAPKTLFDEE